MAAPSAEMLLAALLGNTRDGVLAFDREYRYTVWSSAMERISGMTAAQVIGRVAFEVFPFLIATGETKYFDAALRGETATSHAQRFVIPETGREGLFEGRYMPLRDPSGAVIGGTALIQDVTADAELRLGAERLHVALHATRLGPWEWDLDSDVVILSERAAEIFGVDRRDRLTRSAMRELLYPEDRDRAGAVLAAAIAERTSYDVEYRLRRANGGDIWVSMLARATYDDAGKPVRMFGVVQDITARKQVEQALLDEVRTNEVIDRVGKLIVGELDLGKLLQAVTDAATELCDAQFGSFFYNVVNTTGESYMLYTLSGVPREAFSKFPMPRNTKVFAPTFAGERIVRSDDITNDPMYGQSAPHHGMPKGHLPVRSYLAVPVTSRTGEVLGGLFFGHEQVGVFTARHEQILRGIAVQAAIAIDNARLYQQARTAEQDARERAEALAEAHRHKDDFLAMLAHELRNPLSAVSNAVHVMSRSKPGDTAFERSIQIATRQIAHQRKLVDDLLDVSRIARGKVHLQREKLDLVALARDTAEDHRPAITAAGLRLDVELPSERYIVDGDRVRLAQVVGNLLDNARKFTRSGGRIRLHLETDAAGEVVLRVTDNGIGIEPHLIPSLFSPFTQAERSLARSQGGLGLGLALAKGLVELHDGKVTVTSAGPDHGTEVTLVLPLTNATMLEVAPARAFERDRHAHVLVVDDLHDAADTLRELLVLMGCTVDVAYDAKQALSSVRARRPDVVVCDLGLPGEMNGYDFARVVIQELGRDAIRLVALTGYGSETDERASREAGFSLHLTKPLRPEQLDEVIGRPLGRSVGGADR